MSARVADSVGCHSDAGLEMSLVVRVSPQYCSIREVAIVQKGNFEVELNFDDLFLVRYLVLECDDVSRRDSQMDDDTQRFRELHLRCSIEQKQ